MKDEREILEKKLNKLNKNSVRIEKFYSEADYFLHSSAYLNPFVIFSRGLGCIMIGPALLSKKINNAKKIKLEKKYKEINIVNTSQKIK